MKVVAIRHGERDYAPCKQRGFIGQGLELATLTEKGVRQAEEAAANPLLAGAQLILSSPYTRCMQTAAIISRITGIPLTVEMDLHEWIPDLTFQNRANDGGETDFAACKGRYPQGETRNWETIERLEQRLLGVLDRYTEYDKIIIVTHGMLMRQIKPYEDIPHCFVDAFEYSVEFKCAGLHERE